MTTIDIRSDLFFLKKQKGWNLRVILEEALLSKVTPEDLAFAESARLEKDMERQKKILENKTEMKI
jgi:hypothetical protein